MKRKITFKIWLSVVLGGISQFFLHVFSWNNKNYFWRVIWCIITICTVSFTVMLGYAFHSEFFRDNYYRQSYDSNLSDKYKFRDNGSNERDSYIYEVETHKKVLKGIDWIAVPEDGDSLIVVAKNGKRGFVNRYSMETTIPFIYDAAWVFTEGVAAVSQGDSVFFINHNGKPINDKKFYRHRDYRNYVFHGNFSAIPDKNKFGLINKEGQWILLPEYEDIHIGSRNMWYVKSGDKWGVVGTDGNFIFNPIYENVEINPDNGIIVVNDDHSKSRYDYDGTLVDEFIIGNVFEMAYYINEFNEEGDQKKAIDDMLKYSVGSYYGLMTRKGIPVTPPLYSDIQSVSPGVYICEIPETYESIMVNAKGEKINN